MKNEEMALLFSEATPYIQKYHGKTLVIKYGGNAMVNDELKLAVMNDLVTLTLLGVRVVLVHGGGPAINKMLAPVNWDECKLFVEYGPGVGTFCRPVLERMRRDAQLIVIDTNPLYIDYLKRTIGDSRFIAVNGSAADVEDIVRAHGHDHADYVLSGLPFSTLPDGIGPAIAAATHRVLRPGGAFLVYQFSAKARDFMARHFARIDNGFELFNILPCQLFWGWKDAEDQ